MEPIAPDTLGLLSTINLFKGMPPSALKAVAPLCRYRTLVAGEVLIREGESGNEFFAVVSGRLTVSQIGPEGKPLALGEVRPGEHLGEIALLEETRRMATATAGENSEVLSLARQALRDVLRSYPAVDKQLRASLDERKAWAAARRYRPSDEELVGILGQLTGLDDSKALRHICGEVRWVTLPRDTVLISQGTRGTSMYFVVSGRLRVYVEQDDGEQVRIAEIAAGESVGEMALLGGELRAASVAAEHNSELLRLSSSGFGRLVEAHPASLELFTRLLVERLQRQIRGRSVVTQLRTAALPTPAECDEVTKTENWVLRNLRITQMYYRLSIEMTMLVGHDNANWCTFACNASKTAGYSIRGEALPLYVAITALKDLSYIGAVIDRVERLVIAVTVATGIRPRVALILARMSDAISAANLMVFAELAPLFSRFIRLFHEDREYDRNKLADFLAPLSRGSTETGGQDSLVEAFTHYYDAIFEPHPKRRAETILLANCKIGLHEQTRLQPNILAALDAPVREELRGLLSVGNSRWLPAPLGYLARKLAAGTERILIERAVGTFRRLATRTMMRIRLPYGDVNLGRDLPRLPKRQWFPDMLLELEDRELRALFARYDTTTIRARGSHARDWGNLDDRMNFILNLFRSRQKSLELFDQPFLMEQRQRLEAGEVPSGSL